MRSLRVAQGQSIFTAQQNSTVADVIGAAQLLVHQQLGVFAMGTNATNTKTLTLTINGTAVVFTFVSSIGSTAGNVLIGASAAATLANLIALLSNPQTTTTTGVALSGANCQLISYLSYALSGTNITIGSLNSTVYAPETSFTASTTVTSASYTANTMAVYVEPGIAYIGGVQVVFAGGSTGTITAPASNPRIDIVTIDSSGTVAVTTGTENASPVAPTYPTNKVTLCEIYNVTGETLLLDYANQASGQGYISKDSRPTMNIPTPTPVGTMNMFAGSSAPTGWLLCDGTGYSNATTYAALYSVIGYTFGGSSGTFNVPDMRGRAPVGVGTGTGGAASGTGLPTGGSALTAVPLAGWKGEETHTLTIPELPAHHHLTQFGTSGEFGVQAASAGSTPNVNTGDTGGGGAHNNIQPVMGVNFIIKY